jgi:hypothetical protein
MDEIALRKALATLRSFADNLPKGDIEQKYVNLYHGLLDEIHNETGQDLSYFVVPDFDMNYRREPTGFDETGEPIHDHSGARVCENEMFSIKYNGAMNTTAL